MIAARRAACCFPLHTCAVAASDVNFYSDGSVRYDIVRMMRQGRAIQREELNLPGSGNDLQHMHMRLFKVNWGQ